MQRAGAAPHNIRVTQRDANVAGRQSLLHSLMLGDSYFKRPTSRTDHATLCSLSFLRFG